MDDVADLDTAACEIERRAAHWRSAGFVVGAVSWRDQGGAWPPSFKTDHAEVKDADSIGIVLRRGAQEGEVVLFKGGWCDFVYWSRDPEDEAIQDAPGYPNEMTAEKFGRVLDRLAGHFR